jgi:hypothetical protein
MTVANTLAYYATATITTVKSFIVQALIVIATFFSGDKMNLFHSGKGSGVSYEN